MGQAGEVTVYADGAPGLVRMRVAWSAVALLALLRRWAGFVIVAIAVLGIGYFVAAISWPALPALWASSLSWPEGSAVLVLHSSIATALAWGLREALLPRHWLAAERALPLSRLQRSQADLAVVALAQSPLFVLYAVSLLSWWHADPAWLHGHWGRGAAFLAASVGLSLASATALMAARRRQARPVRDKGSAPASAAGLRGRLSPFAALILLPLWRGPARPVLAVLTLSFSGLLLCLAGAAFVWPDEPRWCLAAYAFIAMTGCTRAHALSQRMLGPLLLAAGANLPLPRLFATQALRLLALAPAAVAWPLLLGMMLIGPWHLASLAAPLFVLAALLAPALQLWAPAAQAEPRAAAWLLSLVLWIALATEILQ